MARTLILLLCIGFLTLSFQNCGRVVPGAGIQSGVISLGSSVGKALCDNQIKAVYASTYHSFFSRNCTACHQHTASHASPDISISYQAFQDKGKATLDTRANTPHGPGYTPPGDVTTQLASMQSAWSAAKVQYDSCLTSIGPITGGPSGAMDIELAAKEVPNLNSTRANATTFVTVSWNVATETDKSMDANKLQATFSVQAALMLSAGTRANAAIDGIFIRNPTLTLNGIAGPVQINDLALYLEGEEMSQFTIYKNGVLLPVSGNTAVNMAPNLGTGYSFKPGFTATSRIAFKLKGVTIGGSTQPTTPGATPTPNPGGTTTTFTELNGTNAMKNVFARTCNSCHSPGGQAGLALDLTNYTAARGDAQNILNRINNGSMPPGQPLGNADRQQVQSWVNGGTPQ